LDAIGAVAGGVWELARSTSVQLDATSLAALLAEGTAGGKDRALDWQKGWGYRWAGAAGGIHRFRFVFFGWKEE